MMDWYVLFRTWLFVSHLYNQVVKRKEKCNYRYSNIMKVARELEHLEEVIEECVKEVDDDYIVYSQNWASGYYMTFRGWFVEKIDRMIMFLRKKNITLKRDFVLKLSNRLKEVMEEL